MAKSKKTVEIPLVRSGAAVESGDVNFTFNNELIGSLSESGTAVLKTKDTIVRKDIEVEYTKPAVGTGLKSFSYTDTTDRLTFSQGTIIFGNDNDYHTIIPNGDKTLAKYYIPDFSLGEYGISGYIISESDNLNVILNNSPVLYDNGSYIIEFSSENYNDLPDIVITVTAK